MAAYPGAPKIYFVDFFTPQKTKHSGAVADYPFDPEFSSLFNFIIQATAAEAKDESSIATAAKFFKNFNY